MVAAVGDKRKIEPGSRERIRTWARFGSEYAALRDVALKLLSCHATSAATERNWSLWGRMYTSARSALGMERAKCMIAICAQEKARISEREAFQVTLDVIEDTV